ncbi:MAG: polyhydroxyalkanoate depolymerase [Acetobacteraceae bacterium]|nr:polyhydroxyalkanoate depolymerase [Acetobacteraceae bacterium]
MMYQAYQAKHDLLHPLREAARFGAAWVRAWDIGAFTPQAFRAMGAVGELIAQARLTHTRPDFGIQDVQIGNVSVAVTEEAADETPFGTLLRFRKDTAAVQPRVMLVAPMSGHFATLLRATVKTMLPDHDLFITDWKNARDIPPAAGTFGFDAYVEHLIRFQRVLGPGAHIVAVCQPTVAALAAAAIMAEARDPAQPRSLTLMAGPLDTRVNPTKVNALARSRPIEWFEKELIAAVPWRFPGGGRRVYPGFLQLTAFMTMNLERHINAHLAQFRALSGGELDAAAAHRNFYDEYGAVMDLPAEFFLETVQRIFQEDHLPLGKLTFHGEKVSPAAIRRTALLTVEGERDDICAVGQTVAALDMCSGVRVDMKSHHLQSGVGHYGVFSGRRWEREVYPKVRQVIQTRS